ncbi:MAG TPA: adenylyltransferase/cytidyltransferase family protein [Candidatus Paceibacterota bacterium]|nr:adenylyltransferase/cytidyltransferase family protein [Candidatus Paceibacterota bacterium]
MRNALKKKKETWVAVSGGFDPLHIGHVRMFKAARKLGDKLVVILNNDHWLKDKKGFSFMPEKERAELIKALPFVDKVVLTGHSPKDPPGSPYHRGVSRELKRLRPAVFANGGDRNRKDARNVQSPLHWDIKTCKELGIQMAYNVGHGGKVQSSSWMIKNAARHVARNIRPWGEFYNWDTGKKWHLKTIYVKPKSRLSLQYHNHRSEHWVLVEGEAMVLTIRDGKEERVPLKYGDIFWVERGTPHRLMSEKGAIIVEVALGQFDEDDIVRLDDDFGRLQG